MSKQRLRLGGCGGKRDRTGVNDKVWSSRHAKPDPTAQVTMPVARGGALTSSKGTGGLLGISKAQASTEWQGPGLETDCIDCM